MEYSIGTFQFRDFYACAVYASEICISSANQGWFAGGILFMARPSSVNMPHWQRKHDHFFLAFCWCLGLLCGIFLFRRLEPSGFPLMRSAIAGSVSIVGLICVGFLPFLFTAFAVYISEPWLLFLVCFAKACLFSFVSAGIYESIGSSGWLIRLLMMFSDSICVLLLYFSWLRLLSGHRVYCFADMFVCFSATVLVCSVDYCIIAPFLARLIEI